MTHASEAVSFSDHQLRLVERHAAGLKVHEREVYLRFLSSHLCGQASDDAMMMSINNALDKLSAIKNSKGVTT